MLALFLCNELGRVSAKNFNQSFKNLFTFETEVCGFFVVVVVVCVSKDREENNKFLLNVPDSHHIIYIVVNLDRRFRGVIQLTYFMILS